MNHQELEEGDLLQLDFTKLGKVSSCGEDLIPAVAQDHDTGEVLIVGYANELAFQTALKENMATFWSTSAQASPPLTVTNSLKTSSILHLSSSWRSTIAMVQCSWQLATTFSCSISNRHMNS
mgnify:CR=1 FL=1